MTRYRKRNLLIAGLCLVVLVMAIGYAAFSSNLNISGISNITSKWKIVINNIVQKEIGGEAEEKAAPTFDSLSANFGVVFKKPGDYVTYTVTVENQGTLNAVLDNIKINLEKTDVVSFKVDGLSSGDKLNAGGEKQFDVTFKFNDDVTSQPDKTDYNVSMNLNFLQEGSSTDFSGADSPSKDTLTINSINLTSHETTVEVGVNASNATKYYYSLDNDKYFEVLESSYIFSDLKPYTEYTIWVKAEDNDGNVVVDSKKVTTVDITKPTINLTLGDNVEGNNDWYKGVTIDAEVKDNDKLQSINYCITTEETCTPNTELTLNNNIGTVQLSSNKLTQKVCVKAIDRKGNETTKCTSEYKVDSEQPTLTNMTLIPDDDTMLVEVTGTDNASGLYKYYFSKDSGSTYVESSNPNYTFTELEEGDYLVTAYVEDIAGIKSEIMTKSTTIRHKSWCEKNGITDMGDCIIATEAKNTDITQAKSAIEAKGTPTFTKTSPSIVYSEKHATTTTTTNISTFYYIANTYSFSRTTGYYTLTSPVLTNPETLVIEDDKEYFTCPHIQSTCTTLYKITKFGTSTNESTGEKIYKMTYYPYTTSVSSYDNSEAGLYAADDDSGTSYYYRGAVSGNYVKMANKYWRVIRVNGDKTVRLIYDGTTTHENGETSDNRQTTYKAFNSCWSDNAYVGYMYGDPSSNTITENKYAFGYSGLNPTAKYYFGTTYTFNEDKNEFTLAGDLVQLTTAEYNEGYNSKYLYTLFSTSADKTSQRVNHVQKYLSPTSMSVKAVEWSSGSYNTAHNNTKNSTIKEYLDGWYNTNLNTLDDKISKEAIFCNNRKISTKGDGTYTNEGYGSNPTMYGYTRFYDFVGSATGPDLTCPQSNDKFTASASIGNGKLNSPIGLITADEVNMAGGRHGYQNTLYYLYTGTYYWTMSPSHFNRWYDAYGMNVTSSGDLTNHGVNNPHGVRPVINIDPSKITFMGSGTAQDPFVVE